ncbi:hypothetical protein [Nocardia abscessus]|uniref:hypothetical protein n=1 Tax=Nocardia abscessus TaxID=120957 RepID=UPI0012F96EC5|nr:hypothetical protein [Nocardia abscessus]MCC3331570.1 hypothetical protein [Nocardia abscessus]
MIQAVPSLVGVSSISTRCGANELVTMLRPSASGAWPNRAESEKLQARDQAPKVSPTVVATVIPIHHGWTGLLSHTEP